MLWISGICALYNWRCMSTSPEAKRQNSLKLELASFASSFASEAQLTDAIAELLRRMGREGVQILHGQQEYGKDVIFYAPGGFQERRLYACVIKNIKLSGRMDSDSGTRTVFHQAETAFDTPITTAKGHTEHVEGVYVITPHECSQVAIAAIREKLKERSGQVTFLCGAALFDLFVLHWPDFVLFDSGTLTNISPAYPRHSRRTRPSPIWFVDMHCFQTP